MSPSKNKHYKKHSYESWGLENLLNIIFQTLIMPIPRIWNYAISTKPKKSLTKLILNFFFMGMVLAIFFMFKWWYGFGGLIGILILPFLIGMLRKNIINRKLKNQQVIKEIEVLKSETKTKRIVRNPKVRKPTISSIPDFPADDLKSWSQWFRNNPDSVSGARKS